MNPPLRRVLIVGAGTAGSVATLALRRRDVEVVLVEREPDWKEVGHGITLQGNALRALAVVGVADQVIAAGYPWSTIRFRDADGTVLSEMPMPELGGADLPAGMGSMRYRLQQILTAAVREAGADVRTGTEVNEIKDSGKGVCVTLSDGSVETVDLVIGADGMHSTVRELIGVRARREPVGMAIFRMEGRRPEAMTCSEMYYGGPRFKAGYTPTSAQRMYAYVLDEDRPVSHYGERPLHEVMRERSEGYGGLWDEIRNSIGPDTLIDYRSLEALRLDGPWYRGRVLLIGDAAHACPPMLAQGAAMAAEDGVVLGDLVGQGHAVDDVLAMFMARRQARAAMVVDNSVQLARWESSPGSPGADPAGLMTRTMASLARPF